MRNPEGKEASEAHLGGIDAQGSTIRIRALKIGETTDSGICTQKDQSEVSEKSKGVIIDLASEFRNPKHLYVFTHRVVHAVV